MATDISRTSQERADHDLVADALASIRLFHGFYGDTDQYREWVREAVRSLHRLGKQRQQAGHPHLLTTTADAIARSYLGTPVDEMDWPTGID